MLNFLLFCILCAIYPPAFYLSIGIIGIYAMGWAVYKIVTCTWAVLCRLGDAI